MRLLSIDPGMATGWTLWEYDEHTPMERIGMGVIPGGVHGFIAWWEQRHWGYLDVIVFEQFVLGDDFVNDRTMQASKIEGAVFALVTRGFPVYLQRRVEKRAVPDRILKLYGLWVTGKDVAWEDGRDVNDSTIHAIAWAKLHHEPTLHRYFGDPALQDG